MPCENPISCITEGPSHAKMHNGNTSLLAALNTTGIHGRCYENLKDLFKLRFIVVR